MMDTVKVIIAGGRDFTDLYALAGAFESFLSQYENEQVTVISGMARGADTLGLSIADMYGLEVIKMPADWNKHGKSAGYKRNEEMAKIATHLLAAWDGKSRGTKHMIDLAEQYKLVTSVFKY